MNNKLKNKTLDEDTNKGKGGGHAKKGSVAFTRLKVEKKAPSKIYG